MLKRSNPRRPAKQADTRFRSGMLNSLLFHLKRALRDIRQNGFLNVLTVITIALSILIVSAFVLFFTNANDVMGAWKQGIKIMVYLKAGTTDIQRADTRRRIESMGGVDEMRYIPKEEALRRFKVLMKRQASLFDHLQTNPLPDAFELRLNPSAQTPDGIEALAARLEALQAVDAVEYGQKWIGRFVSIFELFTLTGYALGLLFFAATVFIVANTIRLMLYARREEVEIMRLVGATENFIKAPFYLQGLIQGAVGGVIGIGALYSAYLVVASNVGRGLAGGLFSIRFLPPEAVAAFLASSMIVGWMGCYISLKQFLKA